MSAFGCYGPPLDYNHGRWTEDECFAFESALHTYGTNWHRICELIPTRKMSQIRTHAQKCASRAG